MSKTVELLIICYSLSASQHVLNTFNTIGCLSLVLSSSFLYLSSLLLSFYFCFSVMMGLDLLASDLDDQNSMPIGAPLRRPLSITRRKGENPVQSEDRHCETVSPPVCLPACLILCLSPSLLLPCLLHVSLHFYTLHPSSHISHHLYHHSHL